MRQLAPNCLFRKRCSLVSLAESLGCSQRCIQVAPPRRTNVGAAFLQNYSRRGKREMALFFATKSRPQACCSQLQFPPEILIDDVREEGQLQTFILASKWLIQFRDESESEQDVNTIYRRPKFHFFPFIFCQWLIFFPVSFWRPIRLFPAFFIS